MSKPAWDVEKYGTFDIEEYSDGLVKNRRPLMKAKFGIRAIAFANGQVCPHAGQWLKHFDFEAFDGRGSGVFTDSTIKAKPFPSKASAFDFWRNQSRTRPLRPDGKANRPLTALTVSIEQL